MGDIELPELGSLPDDLENTANIAGESGVNIDANVAAYNERIGQDKLLTIDKDGTIRFNGEEVKSPEDLREKLNSLPADEKVKVKAALANTDLGNVSEDVIQQAQDKGKAANQSQNLEEVFPGKSDSVDVAQAKYDALIKQLKDSSPGFMSKLLKYTCIAGATYAALAAMAAAKTGCYAVLGNQQQLVTKTGGAGDCVSIKGTYPNLSLNGDVDCQGNGCSALTSNVAPTAVQYNTLPSLKNADNKSCNCLDSNNNLINPNVALSYQSPTPWDIFGNAINGIGGFITKLANGALQILGAAADLLAALPKILMWVGIAAAITGVIVGFIYLGKKLREKAKAKKALQSGTSPGALQGGTRKQFKQYKKHMKRIQKYTPLSHMNLTHSIF